LGALATRRLAGFPRRRWRFALARTTPNAPRILSGRFVFSLSTGGRSLLSPSENLASKELQGFPIFGLLGHRAAGSATPMRGKSTTCRNALNRNVAVYDRKIRVGDPKEEEGP